MKFTLSLITLFLCGGLCFGQAKKAGPDQIKIKEIVTGFLKWYKLFGNDTAKVNYSLTKGGYPDTTTNVRIDKNGVEQYLNAFRRSKFVSETYIDGLRRYFFEIDEGLATAPKLHDMVKIPGMDIDFVLQTFEPEAILDHIDHRKLSKLYIIHNKALAALHLSKYIDLLFVLTRQNNQWLIDYMGDSATNKNSFFLQ